MFHTFSLFITNTFWFRDDTNALANIQDDIKFLYAISLWLTYDAI